MVKKFRMPPPIFPPTPDRKGCRVSLEGDADELREAIAKTGIVPLHTAISEKLASYLQRKVETTGQLEKLSDKKVDRLNTALSGLTFLYVGRRLGTLTLHFGEDASTSERNDAGFIMSSCLNYIAKTFGEKQATQIFRKLEKITDEVLEAKFGRSR
jgi:hypothetical protein